MGTALSAFEILTLAVSIERDSVDFYRKASRRYDDEKLRKTFLLLANWEQRHKELFATMKKELTRSPDQCETEGILQPHGAKMIEPRMEADHVGDAVVYMAGLPLDTNVLFMTVMANTMPYVGRG